MFEVASLVRSAGADGEDRAFVAERGHALIIAVADGAGGTGGGQVAAQLVVTNASGGSAARSALVDPAPWAELLGSLDAAIFGEPTAGETTAVIALVTRDTIVGASVGDSEAWLISDGQPTVLTSSQSRKPLIGSGRARPVGFGPVPLVGRLLVGTDGLFKYCPRDRLLALASIDSVTAAVPRLADAARLPSGGMQDDIALVLCQRGAP